jgi:glycosyltransferase involved in cell wall biosynthesis
MPTDDPRSACDPVRRLLVRHVAQDTSDRRRHGPHPAACDPGSVGSATILHVTQIGEYGVAHYVGDLVEVQLADGWDVCVASDPTTWLRERIGGTGARWLDWHATRQPGPAVLGEARRLGALVRDVGADVVHLHSSKAGLAGRLAVRGRRPTIFQPHGWSFFATVGARQRAALTWERFATRWSDAVVCVSDAERSIGVARGIDAPWRVIPTAIDTDRFVPGDRAAARAALGLGDGPVAVCVSRLAVAQKAQDLLVEAWASVEREVPAGTLVLVGDGPDRAMLEARAPASVRFAGECDDVVPWLQAANVVVQPSRYEGLSLSVLEALACGRAVVATDCVGMREAVDGVGGVVPVDDGDALATALVARLVDPAGADEEGAAGRARVLEQFGRGAWRDAMRDVTRDAMASGRR